jgi:hypothetical protein
MATEVPHATDSPEQIRAEIERTRQQLGDTVERLVAKTDVKRRARAEVSALTGRAKSTLATSGRSAASIARENRVPLSVAAGAVLVAVSLLVWQRQRQGKGTWPW